MSESEDIDQLARMVKVMQNYCTVCCKPTFHTSGPCEICRQDLGVEVADGLYVQRTPLEDSPLQPFRYRITRIPTAKAPEPDFDEKRTAPGSYPEELEHDPDPADYDPS